MIISVLILTNILLFLYIYKLLKDLNQFKDLMNTYCEYNSGDLLHIKEYITKHDREIGELVFCADLDRYDFLNYIYRSYHLREDMDTGEIRPTKYGWTMEEELRLHKFKQYLDDECRLRGYTPLDGSRISRI